MAHKHSLKYVSNSFIMQREDNITIAFIDSFKNYKVGDIMINISLNSDDVSTLKINIDNPNRVSGQLSIYLPNGISVLQDSIKFEDDKFITIPLSTETFSIKYVIKEYIEQIKGSQVYIKGDRILLKNERKNNHDLMTDYSKLSKWKALKDRQKL